VYKTLLRKRPQAIRYSLWIQPWCMPDDSGNEQLLYLPVRVLDHSIAVQLSIGGHYIGCSLVVPGAYALLRVVLPEVLAEH
jgi:hypothetical protein